MTWNANPRVTLRSRLGVAALGAVVAACVVAGPAWAHALCRDDVPALEQRIDRMEAELRYEQREMGRGKSFHRAAARRRAAELGARLQEAREDVKEARGRPC